jgi:plastocyanin
VMGRRLWLGVMVTFVVAGLAVPAGAIDPTATVTFQCCSYAPATARVAPGGTVTFAPVAGATFADHPLTFVSNPGDDVSAGSAPSGVTFATAGIYQYYCSIHQSIGMVGEVIVSNDEPPVASFTATPGTASAGQTVSLDASASSDDHGISAYEWDFNGDGTVDETDATPTTTHAFAATATVQLTVVDDNAAQEPAVGDESTSVTHVVSVPVAAVPPGGAPAGAGGAPGTGAPASGAPGTGAGPSVPLVDHKPPRIALRTHALRLADLRAGRAKLTFTTTEGGGASATAKDGATTVATGTVTYARSGTHTLKLKLTTAGRSKLRHATRAALRLSLVARDAAGNRATASLSLPHVR